MQIIDFLREFGIIFIKFVIFLLDFIFRVLYYIGNRKRRSFDLIFAFHINQIFQESLRAKNINFLK